MKTIRINGNITALSPIHHGGNEKTGSEVLFRTMKFKIGKEFLDIPYIDGNAVRGILRRMIMNDFLQLTRYEKFKTVRAYHTFFSGGVLETVDAKSKGYLSLELREKIRNYLPPLSLLGSTYGNQAFSGKLISGKMLPLCKELAEKKMIETDRPLDDLPSYHELKDFIFQTRRDELRAERSKDQQAIQMIINFQVLVPGTELTHYFHLSDTTPVEEGCFRRCLSLWKEKPYIAGKQSSGQGEISFKYDLVKVGPEKNYLKFIKDNKEEIINLLAELDQ
ncbi:MAG: hypothetical protein ACTSO3_13825 [Candidatus Heimdallarchaeaceae archaeon]